MRLIEVIPRFFYEFLAYLVPGVLFLLFIYLFEVFELEVMLTTINYDADLGYFHLFIFILISYSTGRILYAIGDWSSKIIVKKLCGDPDKYLPLNNYGLLYKIVKDYKTEFKLKLQRAISNVFCIEERDLGKYPYFKLCCEWIAIQSPSGSVLAQHGHTIEIFSRNIATTVFLIALIFIFQGRYSYFATAIGIYMILLYYYYIRQVKRARGVYELFYVLYLTTGGKCLKEN